MHLGRWKMYRHPTYHQSIFLNCLSTCKHQKNNTIDATLCNQTQLPVNALFLFFKWKTFEDTNQRSLCHLPNVLNNDTNCNSLLFMSWIDDIWRYGSINIAWHCFYLNVFICFPFAFVQLFSFAIASKQLCAFKEMEIIETNDLNTKQMWFTVEWIWFCDTILT